MLTNINFGQDCCGIFWTYTIILMSHSRIDIDFSARCFIQLSISSLFSSLFFLECPWIWSYEKVYLLAASAFFHALSLFPHRYGNGLGLSIRLQFIFLLIFLSFTVFILLSLLLVSRYFLYTLLCFLLAECLEWFRTTFNE